MEQKIKLIISIIILVIFVVFLLIFVYISSTKEIFETENGIKETKLNTTTSQINESVEEQKFDQETGQKIIATINLKNTQTPNKTTIQLKTKNNEVKYLVRMHGSWSETTHSNWYTEGAYLSPMIAFSHSQENTLFKIESKATSGLEKLTETGKSETIIEELTSLGERGAILNFSIGKKIYTPGENEIILIVSKSYPIATVISTIKPSPDWFIAIQNVVLYENGQFIEKITKDAILLDAGTDDGKVFKSKNKNTNPQENITNYENAPKIPIGTFEFTRIN